MAVRSMLFIVEEYYKTSNIWHLTINVLA